MDDETYRLIGAAYSRIEEREPWLDGVKSISDIALLSYDAWRVEHPDTYVDKNSDIGALRILLEGHYLFDVIDLQSDFTGYKVLILPDNIRVDESLKRKLDAYVALGGKLIASGKSTLPLVVDSDADFLYDLGATYVQTRELRPSYLVPTQAWGSIPAAGYVVYATSERAMLKTGGKELAAVHNPYFQRTAQHFCSHMHAPEKHEYDGVGVSEGRHGIYISSAIFREYVEVGSLIAKQIVSSAIDSLLGEAKTVNVELPAQGIVTLMEQSSENRAILHLVYAPRVVKGNAKTDVNWEMCSFATASGYFHVTVKDGEYEFKNFNEDIFNIFKKIVTIIDSEYFYGWNWDQPDRILYMDTGRAFFSTASVDVMIEQMMTSEVPLGVLPYPTAKEGTTAQNLDWAGYFVISRVVKNQEMSGSHTVNKRVYDLDNV